MHIERLSLEQAAKLSFIEVAAASIPTSRFVNLAIEFDPAPGDMDELLVAAFRINGKEAFALAFHRRNPGADITLMVEEKSSEPAAFIPIMHCVAKEFDFSPASFYWLANGETVRLAVPNQQLAKPATGRDARIKRGSTV